MSTALSPDLPAQTRAAPLRAAQVIGSDSEAIEVAQQPSCGFRPRGRRTRP